MVAIEFLKMDMFIGIRNMGFMLFLDQSLINGLKAALSGDIWAIRLVIKKNWQMVG